MLIQAHQWEDTGELKRRIRREKDAEQRDRYRAVLLALEGLKTTDIIDKLGRSRGFVQRWVYIYRDQGIEAIRERPRPGAAPKLSHEQAEAFRERFGVGPTDADGVCTLRGEDAVRILEREFGVKYSLSGAYGLLHRLGFSCLRPRPQHRKNDLQPMQQWREEAPLLSTVSAKRIPTSASKCGSRTKRASDNREP